MIKNANRILLMLALSLLLTLACDDSPTETITDDNGDDSLTTNGIVFTRQAADRRSTDIMYVNPDGSGLDKIHDSNDINLYPKVSPDGSLIVFSSDAAGDFDLYRMAIDGSNVTRISSMTGDETRATWSPDGSSICFERFNGQAYELYIIGADGSNATYLNQTKPNVLSPVWTSTGIYFSGSSGIIYQTNSSGSDPVAYAIGITDPKNLEFAPNGMDLAMDASRSDAADTVRNLFVGDLSGPRPVKISVIDAYDEFPSWSPDGNQLVFRSLGTRGDEADYGLYISNEDGSERVKIAGTQAGDSHPDWFDAQ